MTVTVLLNGEPRGVPDGHPLDELVAGLTAARSGVAVAVNQAVVPRAHWAGTRLAEGDRVEILVAVQGG
jgi:sulfur carrier protein